MENSPIEKKMSKEERIAKKYVQYMDSSGAYRLGLNPDFDNSQDDEVLSLELEKSEIKYKQEIENGEYRLVPA